MSFHENADHMQALLDYCDGDVAGLKASLGESYSVVKSKGDDWGYGHHSYDTIYRATDGRLIHAECGGCSCGGSGTWTYVDSMAEAERLIPEDKRD